MMSNKVRSIRTFILLSLFIGVFLSIIQSLGYFAKFDAIFYGSDLSVQNQDFLNPDGVLVIALFAVLPGIAIILWGSEKGLICAIGCLITYYGGAWLYWKHLALMLPLVAPTVATLLCVVRAFGWRPVLVVDETPERSKASLHPPVQKTGYDVFIIMKSIFLSHVSEDSTIGLDLADELGKEGFTVWSYERDYIAGTSYLITTREAIDECKALVILISDDSIKSHQIDVELEHAHEEARPSFPVRLGVTDAYYKGKKPSWAQMIGTRTSTPISEGTVPDAAQRLCTGFRKMGIRPSDGQPKEKETVSPVDSKWSKNPEEHKNEKVSPRPIRRPKTMVWVVLLALGKPFHFYVLQGSLTI